MCAATLLDPPVLQSECCLEEDPTCLFIAFALLVPPVGVGLVPFLTVGLSSTAGLLVVVFTIRMTVARALVQVPVVT